MTVRADTLMQTMADSHERDRLLRNLIMPKATPEQLDLVLAICERYNLDPLLRHVLIVSGNLYVTRDGLRHLAWQSGEFDGYGPIIESQDEKGKWVVTVSVYRKGIHRPFSATAYQSESENTSSPVWRSHPRLMTGKTAEVMVLRMAFGVSLSGAEEIGFDDSNQTKLGEARFVESAPTQIAAPREKAAPPPLPAEPLPAEEFRRFIDAFLIMAEEGHSNGALIGAMAAQAPVLDQAQRDELKAHFGMIATERKATRARPAPSDALTREIIEANVTEVLVPPPTAAALAASGDAFGDGRPASIAG